MYINISNIIYKISPNPKSILFFSLLLTKHVPGKYFLKTSSIQSIIIFIILVHNKTINHIFLKFFRLHI
jgi:hypothetical protein